MPIQIITISRELGSGGRSIGKKTAELLGWSYYDRELIDEAAKASGLAAEYIGKTEERVTNSLLYNLAMGNSLNYSLMNELGQRAMPLVQQVYLAQQNVILKYAQNGPCVIVGRCADYIL